MSVHNTIISSVAKGDFPSPIIRRMPFKSNLKELANYRKSAPKGNRDMIDKLTELYYNKKIPKYRTVENVIIRLLAGTKNRNAQAKAVREFDKVMQKYTDAMPTTGRIARQIPEKRKKVLSKVVSITLILFRLADAGDAKATVSVPGVSGEKAKEDVRKEAKKDQANVANKSAKAKRKYEKLEQFYIGSCDLRGNA